MPPICIYPSDRHSGMDGDHSPAIIYLSSSGGRAGSRVIPELVTRRRFPFRRYSVGEDGSLSVRVRHSNRDARHRPYTPGVRFTTPSRHSSPSPNPDPNRTTVTPNRKTTTELLKDLVPALVEDPTDFEASISSICAAYDIDQSIISAVTQAAKRRSSVHPLERTRTLDRSTPSVSNIPSSSSVSATSVTPIKQERPFPSGSPGATVWYSSHSLSNLSGPSPELGPDVGDLYVHYNRAEASYLVWLYGIDRRWEWVDTADKVYHPIIADRVLSMRANGTPSWITAASYTTIKGRKEKARA